jgi:hypothetical protein
VSRLLLLAALAVVLAAGCGSTAAKIYNDAKTVHCLRAKQVKVGRPPAPDFVATTAPGGSFRARLMDNAVTVAFGDTIQSAQNIAQAYVTFHARNVGINDVLHQVGNAVMLWHVHPSDADISLVQGCLST